MSETFAVPTRCGKCDGCAIHHRAICIGAMPQEIAELNRISHLRDYARGQVILGQGEETSIVGNVVSGVVKLMTSTIGGQQQIVGLLFPSDFFGRIFRDMSRFSYEAATDVTLCCMNRPAFETFLSSHPQVERELLRSKLDELDSAREWISVVGGHTTMQRVATFIYILSRRAGNRKYSDGTSRGPIISVPINRRDMAAYLGTTPETLSRNIHALSRRKVLRIIDARHFELLNEAELMRQAGWSREDLENITTFGI